MRKLRYASMTSAIALAACFGAAGEAKAQFSGPIYTGGGTLASKIYRQLFDCVGVAISGAPSCADGPADGNIQILYAPVGSGGGKRAFLNHDGSSSATIGLGVPATTNTVPFTSTFFPTYGYPNFHFAGSDDVINATDKTTYYTGPNLHGVVDVNQYGAMVELPSLITPITIPFNGKDGAGVALNINAANPNPTGAVSQLDLSMQAVCGIFSGHITQWNNAILTALNGGTTLGTGQITVEHRSDGSGTTFLTTNGLVAQCAGITGPNNEGDPTIVSYAFPWTDRLSKTNPPPVEGSNSVNWPDLGTDQFGTAITTPAGSKFVGGSGSSTVAANVASTNGAIGYLSPDFTAMVPPNTLLVANLNDPTNGGFQAPTSANAAAAMSSANLGAFTVANVTDPLTWSQIGVVSNPGPATYPLAGITWLDFYQCYAPASGWGGLIIPYLLWHYTSADATTLIQGQGFAPIPNSWFFAIEYLVATSTSKFGVGGSGVCTGIPGA